MMAEHSEDCNCTACFQYEPEMYYGVPKDKEIAQFKADLSKYAGHTAECASRKENHPIGVTEFYVWDEDAKRKCDCGLEQDKERWE